MIINLLKTTNMGKLKYPLGILLTMILGALLNAYLCCGCWGDKDDGEMQSNSAFTNDSAMNKMSFINLIDLNGNSIEQGTDNLNFNLGTATYIEPVSDAVKTSVGTIKTYLDEHPDNMLILTGMYRSSEENNSIFANLGEARANKVKNYLGTRGYDLKKIEIQGKLNDSLIVKENIVYGPIAYSLGSIPKGDDLNTVNASLDALAARIKANPLTLYFNTGQTALTLTPEQKQKVSDMVRYLEARENATLQVTGHTDNVGNPASNTALSLERANFAKNYLDTNGIPQARILTTGKGPDEPIAPNTTAGGRALNRRVVVSINN